MRLQHGFRFWSVFDGLVIICGKPDSLEPSDLTNKHIKRMIFKFLFFISIGHFGPALVVGQEQGRHEHTLTSNAVSTTHKPKGRVFYQIIFGRFNISFI